MTTWAQLSGNNVVSFEDENPTGKYHPSIKWAVVPQEFVDINYQDLVLKSEKLEPRNLEDFEKFLFTQIKKVRENKINIGHVEYKNHNFKISQENHDVLTAKYASGNIAKAAGKPYVINFKSSTGFLDLNLDDISTIILLVDSALNDIFNEESMVIKDIQSDSSIVSKIQKTKTYT